MTSGADEINLCFRVYGDGMEELGICVLGIAKEGMWIFLPRSKHTVMETGLSATSKKIS